jgi:uncharacterized membrane protein
MSGIPTKVIVNGKSSSAWTSSWWALWSFTLLLCFAVFALSTRYLTFSRSPYKDLPVAPSFDANREFLYIHIIGALTAIIIFPFQLCDALRRKYLNAHRWAGRCYVGGVTIGSIGGFVLGTQTYVGFAGAMGFCMLAVMWFFTTAMAVYYIRFAAEKEVAEHRRWMLRSCALTFAAVTLRTLGMLLQVFASQEKAYTAIAWFCWVPNIILMELYLGWEQKRSPMPRKKLQVLSDAEEQKPEITQE